MKQFKTREECLAWIETKTGSKFIAKLDDGKYVGIVVGGKDE